MGNTPSVGGKWLAKLIALFYQSGSFWKNGYIELLTAGLGRVLALGNIQHVDQAEG